MCTGISWICFVENLVLCDEHGSCGGLLSANRLMKSRGPASDTDSDPDDNSGSQDSVSVPVAEPPVHAGDLGCDGPLGVRGVCAELRAFVLSNLCCGAQETSRVAISK